MGNMIFTLILVMIVALIVTCIARDHKKGVHICGGKCDECHCSCSHISAGKTKSVLRYKTTAQIDGMMCGMCENHVACALRKRVPGSKVKVSHKKGTATITSVMPVLKSDVEKALDGTGYTVMKVIMA